ncbi:MAG TPA: hypothetical protein VFG35_30395 [Actinoplanes sp.]|nr:hypothetical protein [Actinoplanes sp.]
MSRPGQDVTLTYAGTAGQLLDFEFTAYTMTYGPPRLEVYRPDGTLLTSLNPGLYRYELPALPTTGTYTLVFDVFSSTGSLTGTLAQRQSSGTLTTTGSGVAVTIGQAGVSAELTFTASAGQRLAFGFTGWTFPTGATVRAQILDPNGQAIVQQTVASQSWFWNTLATAGTYRLVLRATDGVSTGAVTVTMSEEISGGALTIGTARTISVTRPAQTTRFTFSGTTGQRLSLSFGSYTFPHALNLRFVNPDGTTLRDATPSTTQLDLDPLPTTGTYQVVVEPIAETGSAQLTLLERVDAGTLAPGAAAKTVTISSAGRYAELAVTATAGERLTAGFSNSTFATGTLLRVRLISSAGLEISDSQINIANRGSWDATVPTAGTYRLIIGSMTFGAGAIAVTLSDQTNSGTITLNSAKTVTFSRLGQSTRMTYSGTAGQLLTLNSTNVTLPFYPNVQVLRPDGTVLSSTSGQASFPIAALPSTGTYTLMISPYSATGAATFTLVTRTSLAEARTTGAPVRG